MFEFNNEIYCATYIQFEWTAREMHRSERAHTRGIAINFNILYMKKNAWD